MHIKLFVGFALTATSSLADVGHYREMATKLVLEGDRYYSQKKYVRAIESYHQVFRYDSTYGAATHAGVRIARILHEGRRSEKCFAPFVSKELLLFLRYAIGTPTPKDASRRSPGGIDPVSEARSLYTSVTRRPARELLPLSNALGERRGLDEHIERLDTLGERVLKACHEKMAGMEQGGFERELGIIRSTWREPANAAIEEVLAAKSRFPEEKRELLFVAACSDWHDNINQRPLPCDLLRSRWSDIAYGHQEAFEAYLTDVDPGLRDAAIFFLSRIGKLDPEKSRLVLDRFLRLLSNDGGRVDADILKPFEAVDFATYRPLFEEQFRLWQPQLAGASNTYPLIEKFTWCYRALYQMGEPGRVYVRTAAETAKLTPGQRAAAAKALVFGSTSAEAPLLEKLAEHGDAVTQEQLAYGFRDAKDVLLVQPLAPLVLRGRPEATYRALQALANLDAYDYAKHHPDFRALLAEIALTVLQRNDLGDVAAYCRDEGLRLLRKYGGDKACKTLLQLKLEEPRILFEALTLASHRVRDSPDDCANFARGLLNHQDAQLRTLAQRIIDDAELAKKDYAR